MPPLPELLYLNVRRLSRQYRTSLWRNKGKPLSAPTQRQDSTGQDCFCPDQTSIKSTLFLICLLGSLLNGCAAQIKNTRMETKSGNPLLCDLETGSCELPGRNTESPAVLNQRKKKPVRILYITDPICSSCWGIEPQLRKLKLEYGSVVDMEYHMGGLLPDWSYNSGGISKPSDVAHHWDEVSLRYDMPIDGDIWLEDPLPSSYPPSIAFKAAQLQDEHKARLFLRAIREMVFMQKKNITRWAHLSAAAVMSGLDTARMKAAMEDEARRLFEEDLALAKSLGVRGFPTLFFVNDAGKQEMVYGTKPYAVYEQAILQILPQADKAVYSRDWEALFRSYPTLTAREFAELSGMSRMESEACLQRLTAQGHLKMQNIRNGSIWLAAGQ